jgi:hypothetical protein
LYFTRERQLAIDDLARPAGVDTVTKVRGYDADIYVWRFGTKTRHVSRQKRQHTICGNGVS